ncbi:LIM/homeobox protein Awh-like [Watersipora subatra]|uniref:LIM/homeobox protein Awh-like n=1 Tax=Watersipora subatra TaxID=2589382 RepID=UPI00355C2AE6
MMYVCSHCSIYIGESNILEVDGRRFHAECLSCRVCHCALDQEEKCYVKDELIYCKTHYYECNGCAKPVFPGHWMRQVSAEIIYHLTCFCCLSCKRQLSTGEQYGLLSGAVYCLLHYEELLTDPQDRSAISKRGKSKRIRTIFSERQVEMLHKTFSIDANPDAAELERLSDITSLSKRVIQVWFQNTRARHKKLLSANVSSLDNGVPGSSTDESVCSHHPAFVS